MTDNLDRLAALVRRFVPARLAAGLTEAEVREGLLADVERAFTLAYAGTPAEDRLPGYLDAAAAEVERDLARWRAGRN